MSETAYLFGYPLALSQRATRDANQLFVGSAAANTRRIWGWIDLGREPCVLSLPDTFGRYLVVCLHDAWHTAFASLGARTTGTGARAFAILGPSRQGMHLRAGLDPIAAPTRIVHVTGCLEASSAEDADLAGAIRVTPLSRWTGPLDGTPLVPVDTTAEEVSAAVEEVERLDARTFHAQVLELSEDNPPEPTDRGMLTQVRARVEHAPPDALELSARKALDALRRASASLAGDATGAWRVGYDLGRYGADYLGRAAAARVRLGADPATDELAAVVDADADGVPLTGQERYVLRFPEDAKPPVSAFWSLSTAAGSISDLEGLVLDGDGSLSIRIQHRPPARDRAANWLTAPASAFSLALRLHWPREEALAGRWLPPPVIRVAP
ncbi:MAG TPA: DUF1214 domain-containing protein [Solirubrobacter sp.]